jgi:Zn-dependent protease
VFGAIRIATIRGIPIRLHITVLALFALLIVQAGWKVGILAGLIVFGSLLLHELGHSIVAQRYGIRIAAIVLHLMGGMALMTRPPERPRHEIVIAAAGPIVSFMLGLLLLGAMYVFGIPFEPPTPIPELSIPQLMSAAVMVNLAMGLFNLIPALPMDGGRIFRATLAHYLGTLRATKIAATVARVIGAGFVAAAFFTQSWSLALIGGLLFLLVSNEVRVAEAQEERKRRSEQAERETREEMMDPFGRRYVVITRLVDERN